MAKRLLALVLCLVFVLPVFFLGAQATTDQAQTEQVPDTEPETESVLERLKKMVVAGKPANEAQRIRQQILKTHITTLEETGYDSMGGRCGLQVGWQLYLLGINKTLMTYHGKDHYDIYSKLETTSGGYTVRAYSAHKYSLLEALNLITRNGTHNAYNIMVGFETTDTEAGALYGHVCFIHAIVDGMVYFAEGFETQFGNIEGEPVVISIDQFAQWFSQWAEYEGMVYFGTKNPMDDYARYPSDLFAECTDRLPVLTLPDSQRAQTLRMTDRGERLHITGLYADLQGQWYYQIGNDGSTGYIPARELQVVLFNPESVTCQDPVLPQMLEVGQRFSMGGVLAAEYVTMQNVRIEITDADGELVNTVTVLKEGSSCDLGDANLRKRLDTSLLAAGAYTYSIYADVQNYYMNGTEILMENQMLCLASTWFAVGAVELPQNSEVQLRELSEGWHYQQGKWYYYQDQTPRIGWFCYHGHDFYMDETGAAVTGWVEINEKMRYFSETGSMRVGWLHTQEGTQYMLRNGVAATGWRTVDGAKYCFDAQGYMLCDGWTELETGLYYFLPDGKAATGWTTVDGGIYSFHADGYLLAKRVEENGRMRILPYDGSWKPQEKE